MVQKTYFIHASKYKEQLRPILQSEWEVVKIPGVVSPYAEAYRSGNGKHTLVYDGKDNACIGAVRTREIKSLESKLKKRGVELTEIKG